ncbi:MAG: hypothetical protein ABEI99_09175 [Halobaculum sp.]
MTDGNSDPAAQADSTRRDALRKAAAGTLILGSPVAAGSASADQSNDEIYIHGDEPETDTDHLEKEFYYNINKNDWYRIESTIRCLGGYATNTAWETTYRTFNYGVSRRYNVDTETPKEGDRIKVLDEHRITYTDDTSDSVNGQIEYSNDYGRVGGWPTPEYTALEMAEDGLEEVAKVAMSSLSSVADLLITYGEVFQKWSQNDNNSDTSGESKTFGWDYGDGWTSDEHSDVGNFCEIDFQQPFDTDASFFNDCAVRDGAESFEVNWKVTSSAPTESATSDISTAYDSNGSRGREVIESMSPEQKKKWGMRKVPIKKVEDFLGKEVEDPVVVDGDKMWFATDPKVSFTTQ